MKNDELIFAKEDEFELEFSSETAWSVLIIDDDIEVHSVTKLALHDFTFENKRLELVSAYSAKEAKEILSQNNNFSFILLDIVMETNHAGLEIVDYLRNQLNNQLARIIIRTGQPGFVPEEDIINKYDINDYKEKTELTATKLYTTTRTALAQYKQLSELENKKNEIYQNLITDKVTNLYSRDKLYNDLEETKKGGLVLIDIDSFSTINNAYGYSIGDTILIEVAQLIKRHIPQTELIYRVESDNFVLLFEDKSDGYLLEIALEIKNVLSKHQFEIKELDLKLYINISIGIANFPNDNLLQKAEIAVNASREKQDNKIEFYSENLDAIKIINNNILWSKRLSHAISSNDIVAYYQPIVECSTEKIVKYETLVRLVYEDKVYSPIHFLGAARNAGLLTKITKIMFEQACHVFSKNNYDFSVNITDHDLMDKNFTNTLNSCCRAYKINPNRVSIEILEEESISKNLQAQETLALLKNAGFKLSIDDFGVEYSNFSQLKFLDIDSVKIDGSYIQDIDTNINSVYITQAILSYTKNIKVKTIAEFVHSKEVFEQVKKLGIDYAQGYYFGAPQKEIED